MPGWGMQHCRLKLTPLSVKAVRRKAGARPSAAACMCIRLICMLHCEGALMVAEV